jgi:putative transposase
MEKTTYAVCRRVQGRHFMLRPDARLTQLFTWLLATCAPAFGVEIHAVCVMSSHFHLVLSVDEQKVSTFMAKLDANLAKAVNVLRRARRGVLWEPGTLGIVECKTLDAVIFELAYCIVNPVAAGLVWQPGDWPGLNVLADQIGERLLEADLPDFYFRARAWSARAALRVMLPDCLVALGEAEARRRIAAEVERQLAKAHADIRARRVTDRPM